GIKLETPLTALAQRLLQLVVHAVAGAVTDQRAEAQAQLARLTEEERDVRVVAGVEDDVGAAALELGHQRREAGRGGGVALLEHHVEAGLLGPLLVALRD